ncbi:hypothetical protein DGI_3243 [Megalodesulfovibrio gigas DSM 1382 = ATCC 19364]|uniref:MlaB-like STAS domain-containing protein n=2 Tax=Megalodesulfovibrio gigas TaxID=879 RepID=T2GEB9_MEGG1|nr:hypothetical protein DGI_3243 [Megalodesulfovibrio gigas DSM 1382 = ATCC 19364]
MRIETSQGILSVLLPAECLIYEVEAHALLLKAVDWDSLEFSTVAVGAGDVLAVDTAYFQLLLSVRQTAREYGKAFCLNDAGEALADIARLYGIHIAEQIS